MDHLLCITNAMHIIADVVTGRKKVVRNSSAEDVYQESDGYRVA